LWNIAGGPQKKLINFILTFYLYIPKKIRRENYHVRERERQLLIVYVNLPFTCLLDTKFCFDAMLCSDLGNENFDVGHIKCSRRPHLAQGPQVPHPSFIALYDSANKQKQYKESSCNKETNC